MTQRQIDKWLTPEGELEIKRNQVLPDKVRPEDVAPLALFLASDDCACLFGAGIHRRRGVVMRTMLLAIQSMAGAPAWRASKTKGRVLPLAALRDHLSTRTQGHRRAAHARAGRRPRAGRSAGRLRGAAARRPDAAATHASGSCTLPGVAARASRTSAARRRATRCSQNSTNRTTELTDSMKMFKWGVEGGKPSGQQAGHAARVVLQGQWPQRGRLRLSHSPRPTSPKITAKSPNSSVCYIIDENGRPHRLGFAIGNEFSDHVTERRNYLLLAHSKLRQCGVGPDAEYRRAARAHGRHQPHPP